MAVFRVEKTKDFTIMSNHHLRNTELSLKAKGLLSLMLSLPEDWDYTTKGLAHICRDGVDSITTALKELERHGYLTRQRLRNEIALPVSLLFKQSAPECSLLSPSLHRHSQSVMPNSCQVSETESPSSLFDGEILAQFFFQRKLFFKFFSCNFPIIWYNV